MFIASTMIEHTRWRPGRPLFDESDPDTLVRDVTEWTQTLRVEGVSHVFIKTRQHALVIVTPASSERQCPLSLVTAMANCVEQRAC